MTNKQFDQRLDEILDRLQANTIITWRKTRSLLPADDFMPLRKEARSAIIELIGEELEDQPRPYRQTSEYGEGQNDLRAQLRNTFGVKGE